MLVGRSNPRQVLPQRRSAHDEDPNEHAVRRDPKRHLRHVQEEADDQVQRPRRRWSHYCSRDEDLNEAIRAIPTGPRRIFKLYLYERKSRADGEKSEESGGKSRAPEPNAALSMMFSLFDSLLDACIVINDKCLVQYANKSAEKFTGFRSRELVGRNVNLLMTDEHKPSHDAYVKSYLKTGQAKIIGSGRDVVIQRKVRDWYQKRK